MTLHIIELISFLVLIVGWFYSQKFKKIVFFPYPWCRVKLLEVLETRKIVLQKEQGMAFARAVAAGFDMDNMADIILFAQSFGASRLRWVVSKRVENKNCFLLSRMLDMEIMWNVDKYD